MAVQGSGVTTLMDVLTELDPGGKQLDIAEVLTQQNEVLKDMHWEEGNSATGHKDAMRTSLPEPSFRAINAGVPVTKAGSTTVEETASLLEDFSQVDRELAIMSGNVDAYRLKQAKPHVQGMSNKMATDLFYGNAATNPLGFTGFAEYRGWSLFKPDEVRGIPKSVRDNPGIYRSIYSGYSRYTGGK